MTHPNPPVTEPERGELIADILQRYGLRHLNTAPAPDLVIIGFGLSWVHDGKEYEQVDLVDGQVALAAGGNQVLWHIQDFAKDGDFTEVWVGTNDPSAEHLPWAVPPENSSFPVPVKQFHFSPEGVLVFGFDGAPNTIQPWPTQDKDPSKYFPISGDLQERIHNAIGTDWNDTVDTDQYVTELYADRLKWLVAGFGEDLADNRVRLEHSSEAAALLGGYNISDISEAAALLGHYNILEPILYRQWEPSEVDGFEVIANQCAPIHQDQANLALGLAALSGREESDKPLIIAALEKVPEHHSSLARPLAAALANGLSVDAGHDHALQAGAQQWATGTFTIEPVSPTELGANENLLHPLPSTRYPSPGLGI